MQVLAGVIGALFGGVVTFVIGRMESARLQAIHVSQDLYRSWHSSEMMAARVRAHDVLTDNVGSGAPKSYIELRKRCRDFDRDEDWLAVTRVLHFFEECGALVEIRAANSSLIQKLLGRYVEYWFDRHIEPLWRHSLGRDDPVELGWYEKAALLRGRVGPMAQRKGD